MQQNIKIRMLTQGGSQGANLIPDSYNVNITSIVQNRSETFVRPNLKPSIVTHIGFLKVHKAASTTTQAIFLRFGWRRNLTFVLSPEYNRFGYPNIISTNESITKYNTLPPPPGKTFDILCNHVVYGEKEWSSVLPSDTVMIGTIREPFGHFLSVLNYFNPRPLSFVQSSVDSSDPVGAFLKHPTRYERTESIRQSFMNNRLAFEYGVSPEIIIKRDFRAFEKYLKEVIDKHFKVVLVAEKYDESLVLMKRKLNWSFKDIMYALKNVRSSAKVDRYPIKDGHRELHRHYSTFDYLLYEFFNGRLSKQIEAEGRGFMDEVEDFREKREKIENFCHSLPENISSLKLEKSKWTDSFIITHGDCELMHIGEIPFVQMIRKRQYGSAKWSFVRKIVQRKS